MSVLQALQEERKTRRINVAKLLRRLSVDADLAASAVALGPNVESGPAVQRVLHDVEALTEALQLYRATNHAVGAEEADRP